MVAWRYTLLDANIADNHWFKQILRVMDHQFYLKKFSIFFWITNDKVFKKESKLQISLEWTITKKIYDVAVEIESFVRATGMTNSSLFMTFIFMQTNDFEFKRIWKKNPVELMIQNKVID